MEKADKFYNNIIQKLRKIRVASFIKYEPVRYTTAYGDTLSSESYKTLKKSFTSKKVNNLFFKPMFI